ncbi:MAG: LPS assembly lipoprotein LptE [Gammaproteobacteria bacterium]|nr:LPS assembly lipoprotein LptE [Gammaproteobacteria bacterium]MDH5692044.1 LPS assembly lipoprotein LptE [Gammaproteobacteria bacterium]
MRVVFFLVIFLALTACGFHLRSAVSVPPNLAPVALRGVALDHAFSRIINRQLVIGEDWVEDEAQAKAVISIEKERWQTRVLTVGSGGQALEQELRLLLDYKIVSNKGEVLVSLDQLVLTRDYALNASQLLAQSGEEQTLREDIYRQAFELILTRMRTKS